MNKPEEVVETDEEPGSEGVNEAVEADLQHSEEEEEEAGRRSNSKRGARSRPADEEGTLARSASTESGFHNHTDRAEGDVICAQGDPYNSRERLQENEEDERSYAVHCRPEAEEYTENAESEHAEAAESRTLPNGLQFNMEDREELMSSAYSGYVYSHHPFHRSEEEQYAEPYDDYTVQEHVYEEIGEAPELDGRETLLLYQQEREEAEHYRKEALGARLHHYDERSDNESDSPEKEAEFAPYPRMDSYEQEEDIDQIVAEVKQSMSSQSLDHTSEEMPEAEQNSECSVAPGSGHESDDVTSALNSRSVSSTGLGESVRHTREQRDAISLAIKDIKEAIEEVKTRTIRSPYTPDEPAEPIWVMRQDISPTGECENQMVMEDLTTRALWMKAHMKVRQILVKLAWRWQSRAIYTSENSLGLITDHFFVFWSAVPGPCDPEDLIDGIIFAANYLGSTQLLSDKTPSKNVRMMQAQEAVSRIKMAQKLTKSRKKAAEGESQPMTEVDLFISTQRIKVLNADSQETMMDHPLRTISYIADIGNIVVLMARRRMPRSNSQDSVEASHPSHDGKRQYKMICHVFESEDAQLIAQSIGQAFSVAYQEFLRANGINPEDLSQKEYSDLLNTQDMYNDDLIHFSKSENCKEVYVEKQKGEILGLVIVESGWGSILPTVIIANMMHAGPSEKSGKLNIGDQIMSINGTSLVGLPLSTCQSIIKGLKNQSRVKLNIVRCPPVTTVLIRRPDLRYQLGFSVQNGIICSLMRGGIAERGGVRVGHRIIEINGQSVVATPHEKIVHILSNAVGEIHMKTMPAAMYRLLTAQEQPVYI
ncbi:amyloid-beta A4 precursor protein-binding family A member 1 [Scyliorhinus canicula]|uniref:amyloid-beta A4 precursor protein-binding family A member 1 n=1 Tax=Scyliorhinus canicula TaxID=7830 RepID=UPI0018F55ECD|nr:amyloid-beta A4 precursor protein-binding family A member 1 [Scyliorhinus canicula]